MTVVVLALDALDAGLVDHFDLDAVRLESGGEIETFANTQSVPYTPEVWATVATGLEPAEHGITGGWHERVGESRARPRVVVHRSSRRVDEGNARQTRPVADR